MPSITNDDGFPAGEHDARCATWHSNDPDDCTCPDEQGKTPGAWADGRMIAFDLESTGKDPLSARIVTATVIDIWPGAKPVATNWLTDVDGQEIPAEAAAIHGVSTEHARTHGHPLAEVVVAVRREIERAWETGVPVVGHNVGGYDLTLLAAECSRYQQPPFTVAGGIVDTLVLDRGADRYRRGKRTLTAACAVYGVELTEADAHNSEADALASARLAWKIAKRYPEIGEMPLAELRGLQARWHAESQHSFATYLRTKVARTISDDTERAALLVRADDIDASADQWPIRDGGGA